MNGKTGYERREKSEAERIREIEEQIDGECSMSFVEDLTVCLHRRGVNYFMENTDWDKYPPTPGQYFLGYWVPFDQQIYCHVCFCPEVINDDGYKGIE